MYLFCPPLICLSHICWYRRPLAFLLVLHRRVSLAFLFVPRYFIIPYLALITRVICLSHFNAPYRFTTRTIRAQLPTAGIRVPKDTIREAAIPHTRNEMSGGDCVPFRECLLTVVTSVLIGVSASFRWLLGNFPAFLGRRRRRSRTRTRNRRPLWCHLCFESRSRQ